MYICPISKKEIEFNSKEELIDYLSRLNPSMMRNFKSQYESKNPEYEIKDFGKEVKIQKIKCFNLDLRLLKL